MRTEIPKRGGFTLIEILGVVVVLSVVGMIVLPMVASAFSLTRPSVMAAIVREIRQVVAFQASVGDVARSERGYPLDLDPGWFREQQFPKHVWTGRPLVVWIVDGEWDELYPEAKHYESDIPEPITAWYNATNGSFCVLVPHQGSEEETLALFHRVHGTAAAGGWGSDDGDDDDQDGADDDQGEDNDNQGENNNNQG